MKTKIIIALSLIIGVCATAYAKDAPPVIRTSVNKRVATVGDHIILSVAVRLSKGSEARFPSLSDDKMGAFELKDKGVRVKKGIFGNSAVTGWYDIVPYATGKVVITPMEIKYKRAKDPDWSIAKTTPVEIKIQSVLPKNTVITDIREIKGPLAYFEIPWLPISLAAAFLVAVTALLIYLRRASMRVPVKLPHETALEELEAIRSSLAQSGDMKEFFVRISDCIRCYIERAFLVKAPEMTTEEFLNSLRASPALTIEQKDLLKDFLKACDLVKFAKYSPSAKESETVFAAAQRFVEETRGTKDA